MGCCGGKTRFKSKVMAAQRRKRETQKAAKILELPKSFIEQTTIDGIPFAAVSDNQLNPKQLRMKTRALRVKSRNERSAAKAARIQSRNRRSTKRKAQEAKLKNNQ